MHGPPRDAFNAVYLIFLLQGIGTLFPWNVFVNAEDYFVDRLCGSEYDTIVEDSIALGYNSARVIAMSFSLRYMGAVSPRWTILVSLTILVGTMVMSCLMVLWDDLSSTFFFTLAMVLVVIAGIFNAISQQYTARGFGWAFRCTAMDLTGFPTTLLLSCAALLVVQGVFYALATIFPPSYTQGLLAGQSMSGLAVALTAMFTELASEDYDDDCSDRSVGMSSGGVVSSVQSLIGDVQAVSGSSSSASSLSSSSDCTPYTTDYDTLGYFATGVVVMGLCLATYPVLEQLPLTRFYMQLDGTGARVDEAPRENHPMGMTNGHGREQARLETGRSGGDQSSAGSVVSSSSEAQTYDLSRSLLPGAELSTGEKCPSVVCPSESKDFPIVSFWQRFEPIAPFAFSVFLVFVVSLALYPGVTSLIVSENACKPGHAVFYSDDVFTLFSFISYNAFDFLGRVSPGILIRPIPNSWLPYAAIARLLFVPLILGCHYEQSRIPTFLPSDVFPLVIIPLFAFTNGYLASLSMVAGGEHGPWAASIMTLFLMIGSCVGSMLSFLVLWGIKGYLS